MVVACDVSVNLKRHCSKCIDFISEGKYLGNKTELKRRQSTLDCVLYQQLMKDIVSAAFGVVAFLDSRGSIQNSDVSPSCSSRVVDGVMILPVLMVMAFPSPSWQGECCVGSEFPAWCWVTLPGLLQ